MRINVYAEELTDDIKPASKPPFSGVSFFLHLPVTVDGKQIRGPFMHRPDDDDSSAVTFWGTPNQLKAMFRKALEVLGD